MLLLLGIIFISTLAWWWVKLDTNGRVYHDPARIPPRRVGLVPGCGQNLYAYFRVEAAIQLYRAGKIQYILVSGDGASPHRNEPDYFRRLLLQAGIPENRIICDFAGFRTYDSIYRARAVFGLTRLTVISQEFHVRRALFIAKRLGIDAIGFCARSAEVSFFAPTLFREIPARVRALLDLYFLHPFRRIPPPASPLFPEEHGKGEQKTGQDSSCSV